MNVLVITDWNPLQGGAEAYAENLCEALREAGDQVRLLTADVSPRARHLADYLAPASDRLLAKSVLQIGNPFAAAAVRKAVREFRPEVALVNMFALYLSPSAIFALGQVPYMLLVSDYKCVCPLGHRLLPDHSVCHDPVGAACLKNGCLPAPHWLRELLRYRRIEKVIRGAGAILATSDALAGVLAEQGIPSVREYIFADAPAAGVQREPSPAPLFVYVGRLDVEKGVDTLLRAFALCHADSPESRLRIIGQGILRPELESLATRLCIRDYVTFTGWQQPGGIDVELASAWALVAPSRWPEPFGLVAVEAIFRGVPAIVPAQGGMAEVVERGVNGLVFPPNDVSALAQCMREIAHGKHFGDHRVAPVHVAQARERFGRDRHVRRLRALLHDLAGGPVRAA